MTNQRAIKVMNRSQSGCDQREPPVVSGRRGGDWNGGSSQRVIEHGGAAGDKILGNEAAEGIVRDMPDSRGAMDGGRELAAFGVDGAKIRVQQ